VCERVLFCFVGMNNHNACTCSRLVTPRVWWMRRTDTKVASKALSLSPRKMDFYSTTLRFESQGRGSSLTGFVIPREDFGGMFILILQAAFNPPFFVCGGLFVKTSLNADPRSLLCKRRVLGFLSSANCQF